MWESTQGSLCSSSMKIHYWPFFKNFSQKVNNPKWPTLRWSLTPHMLMFHVRLCPQGSLCSTPMVIHQSMWIQWLFFKKLNQKFNYPKMTSDPKSVEVTSVTPPKDNCVQVTWKYITVCGYSDPFFFSKTWTKGHWPLDNLWSHNCWTHMCNSIQGSL